MKIKTLFDDDPEEPKAFAQLSPGTSKWKNYWKAHPEEQLEMIVFKNKCQSNKPILRKRKEN